MYDTGCTHVWLQWWWWSWRLWWQLYPRCRRWQRIQPTESWWPQRCWCCQKRRQMG
ncbi:hypothetical protein BC831DRAFT_466001 [Entophlyctis helioformis]|nr:hypothetical protein BC831DRAFT_466001 [Entophlyctis helioformis]